MAHTIYVLLGFCQILIIENTEIAQIRPYNTYESAFKKINVREYLNSANPWRVHQDSVNR